MRLLFKTVEQDKGIVFVIKVEYAIVSRLQFPKIIVAFDFFSHVAWIVRSVLTQFVYVRQNLIVLYSSIFGGL